MGWTLEGGTVVGQNLTPTSKQDRFPTHLDIYGRGGYKAVTSSAERDAIPISRLCLGAEVRVTTASGSTVYYVSKMPDSISDTMTGADCEWTEVKGGGIDLEGLESLKGKPDGLASLDSDGLVPDSQIKQIIFRGKLVSDTVFQHPTIEDKIFPQLDNAIYIDQNGKMYTWTNGKYITKDGIYWQEVK